MIKVKQTCYITCGINSTNPINKIPIRVNCISCTDRKRVFKSMWSLINHVRRNHIGDLEAQYQLVKLADQLKNGELGTRNE